jgi:hypothetical protein
MDEKKYARMRLKALEEYAAGPLKPVENGEECIGRWEMRFTGPAEAATLLKIDQVQWIYDFAKDGTFLMGDEKLLWKLKRNGNDSFLVFTPSGAGAELYGEEKQAFKMAGGKLMLANRDASVVEILTKLPAKAAKKTRRKQRR